MSAQPIPTEKNFFVRFPRLPEDAAGLLAKALDYERCAGNYVRGGRQAEAEHLRTQARAAWRRFNECGGAAG